MAAAAVQLGLIAAMAHGVHVVVAALLVLRSCQPAITRVIVVAEVTPRLPASLRASFLSLESLAGRLGYGALLLGLGWLAGPNVVGEPSVVLSMLRASLIVASLGLLALVLTRRAMRGGFDVHSV